VTFQRCITCTIFITQLVKFES